MRPVFALFGFTLRQMLLSRKTWLAVLFLSFPCILLLIIRNFAPPMREARTLWEMYHVMSQFLLIMGLIPLICMVQGTALIGADVESRTIVYLITRRMHRATVFAAKFVATGLVLAVLGDLAMVGLHMCALAGRDLPALTAGTPLASWQPAQDLRCYLQVIPLAAIGFLAIFSLFGVLVSRPLAMSVVYFVTIELVLGNIPMGVRVYTLLHQIRATLAGWLPSVIELYRVPPPLRTELFPPGQTAILPLLLIVAAALALACVLTTLRELVPAKVSRET